MKRIKIISVIPVLLLVLILLLQSVVLGAEKTVVSMWAYPLTADDEGLVFGPIVEEFERLNPDIDIQIQFLPWAARAERMLTAFAAGTAPDLWYQNDGNYKRFAEGNALVPIDDYIAAEDKEDILPMARDVLTLNDKMWFMPAYAFCYLPSYNLDLVEEAGLDPNNLPATWDEFLNFSTRLTVDKNGKNAGQAGFDRSNVKQWGMGGLGLLNIEYPEPYFGLYYWQAGGSYWDENGTFQANTPEAIEALNYAVNLYDNYMDPVCFTEKLTTNIGTFGNGSVGILPYAGSATILDIKREFPDLRFAVGPCLKRKVKATTGGMSGYAITAQSEHPDLAWRWIEFLTNTDNALHLSTTTGYLPLRGSTMEKLSKVIDPMLKIFSEEMVYARPATHPMQQAVWRMVAPEIQGALVHKKTVKQALDDATEAVRKFLAGS